MRCLKSRYLSDFKLADLSGNVVSEQIQSTTWRRELQEVLHAHGNFPPYLSVQETVQRTVSANQYFELAKIIAQIKKYVVVFTHSFFVRKLTVF